VGIEGLLGGAGRGRPARRVMIVAVRVLSYNIWDGGGDRLPLIADVVALQEVRRESASTLARMLGMELAFGEGNSLLDVHVAWLSRRPASRARNHRLPQLAKTLIAVEVDDLELFATHLTSRREVHLFPREGEIAAIIGVLRKARAAHLRVGDFNALQRGDPVGPPPPAVEFQPGRAGSPSVLDPLLELGYVDCFRLLHSDAPGWTYAASHPWLRLDYAFASPALAPAIRNCDVIDTEPARIASDHLPLLVDVR
jgi:endonuclease/exonuclease/phosphatase family metal-dependent hydrolase